MNNKKVVNKMFDFEIKSTPKQFNIIYDLYNKERYKDPLFKKYFHLWIGKYGMFFLPKKEYFVSYQGLKDYQFLFNVYNTSDNMALIF